MEFTDLSMGAAIIVASVLLSKELRLEESVCPKPHVYEAAEQGFQLRKSNSKAFLLTSASYRSFFFSFFLHSFFLYTIVEVIPRHFDFINQYYQR